MKKGILIDCENIVLISKCKERNLIKLKCLCNIYFYSSQYFKQIIAKNIFLCHKEELLFVRKFKFLLVIAFIL